MVSLAYLITIVAVFVAVVRAEELTGGKKSDVESKWLGGVGFGLSPYSYMGWGMPLMGASWLSPWMSGLYGGCSAYSILGPLYNGMLFAKASDSASSVSRRAISLDSDHLFRRANDEQVSCKSNTGETHSFSTQDCLGAARQLAEKSLSKASVGACTLSLVSPKDRVLAKDVSSAALEKATRSMLKACADSSSKHDQAHPAADKEVDQKEVALLLSRTA
ncbi:hypothetical protein PTTG_04588 [Puccinia triticina 1-1 BBBD Race 1]|uniref:Uncharacterized protein n=1 Tax=Puccinia triticina (isolate 1-1 / race 1 (BBBD)) TaxID=630390 RepID=A0A180FZF0_PUCT1|nr:hypothetical protein PTTG_04588 [Puccinia triticina 1-1 BBBD Race 1]